MTKDEIIQKAFTMVGYLQENFFNLSPGRGADMVEKFIDDIQEILSGREIDDFETYEEKEG